MADDVGDEPLRQSLRARVPELVCAVTCIASVVLMFAEPEYSTIPFHVVWIASSVTYGLRMWSLRVVGAVIALACVTTGDALLWAVTYQEVHPEELAEMPMMAIVFGVLVWHTERRRRAMAEVERLADTEHVLREEQREFVRRASHELRTPLAIARGHVEVVRREIDGEPEDDLGVALDELDRIALITKNLLALSRAQDTPSLRREATDPVELVTSAVSRWGRTNGRTWSVACDCPWLNVDVERMRAALDALIDNAIRYTPSGGRIDVSVRLEDATVTISVADSGPGIDPELLATVFDTFTKSSPSPDRRYKGTGLGLAIVRAAAEVHGGEATAVNGASGGAILAMSFPLAAVAVEELDERIHANVVIEGSTSADRRSAPEVDRRADGGVPAPRRRPRVPRS
ncbi:MAG: two-component sensor histidine kinase [Frankiales bacterium]|nr:two-component sensor histidine kinase [Frankiales bacterium]